MEIISNMKIKFSKSWVKDITIIIVVIISVILFQNFFPKNSIKPGSIQYIKIAGQKIKVDLALNLKTQEQGLSGRKSLNQDEGMLFVFENNEPHFFWMKDMNFPIDMIWISNDLHVIYIKKNADPKSYPN